MTIEISTGLNEARLQATANYIDSGAGAGYFAIYGGTRAANIATSPATPALVQIELTEPCGTVAAGVLSLTGADPAMVVNSGVATWARLFNGDGQPVLDCDCGLYSDPGDPGELRLSNLSLYAGAEVAIVSAALA